MEYRYATELENSTFGILCVTKDNINAPWLSFEAGALSKTMDKSFVSPFCLILRGQKLTDLFYNFNQLYFKKKIFINY